MKEYFKAFREIISSPENFFQNIGSEGLWPSYRFLLITSTLLSILSPIAWSLGVDGSSPVNSSLGAQMNVYPWWRDTLMPQFGNLSYILASATILLTVHIVLLIYTPVMHLVLKLLGGEGRIINAWKSICYGVAPALILGFIPGFGLLTGVYATLLQLSIGPAKLYRLKGWRVYVFYILVMSLAIFSYWNRIS